MPNVVEPKRQQELLRYLVKRDAKNDPPTRSEMGRHLGISAVSAHLLLKALERRGYVRIYPGVQRGLHVTARGRNEASLLQLTKSRTWL